MLIDISVKTGNFNKKPSVLQFHNAYDLGFKARL